MQESAQGPEEVRLDQPERRLYLPMLQGSAHCSPMRAMRQVQLRIYRPQLHRKLLQEETADQGLQVEAADRYVRLRGPWYLQVPDATQRGGLEPGLFF
jgi:hypothetical protein